jgi:branched-chain amino acid transport system substrate-binding protein
MRRRLGWAALVSALPLVAVGCTTTSSNSTTPVLDGTVTIGVAVEQTGDAKLLGEPEEKAIQLAAENINKEGVLGKRLKLLITDTRSNDAEAARQVAALADNTNVVGIVGPGTTATTLPVLPVIETKKVPLISMGAAEAIVTPAEKRHYAFKTPQNGAAIVEVMMRELRLTGLGKIGLLAPNNQFGEYGVAALTAATRQANIDLAQTQRYAPGGKDFSAQVKALIAAGPQAIVVSAIMPDAQVLAKNIKDAQYPGKVFFDPGAGADLFLAGAGEAAENMYMVHSSIIAANHITATTPSMLAQKEFFAEYTQRNGTFSGYASYAADALNLMVAAIRKANSTDRDRVRDALESLEYDGLTGTYKFSPTNHGGASGDGLMVLTVHKGGWVLAP